MTFSIWWIMRFLEKVWKKWEMCIRNIKLVTTDSKKNYLVPEPIYDTKNFLTEKLLATEMRKTKILMNKPVYLGLPILDLSKTVMYEFCMIM